MKSVYPIYLLQSVPAIPSIPSAKDVRDGSAIPSSFAIPDGQPWRDVSHVLSAPRWSLPSDVAVGWRSAPTPSLRVESLLLLVTLS
jgi:hypothetical protein